MKKQTYLVTIKEERIRKVCVDSDSEWNACKKAHKMYCRGGIVLGDRDFHGVKFTAEEENEADKNEYRAIITIEYGGNSTLCHACAENMEDLEQEIVYSIRDSMDCMNYESGRFYMEALVFKNMDIQMRWLSYGYYDRDRNTVMLDEEMGSNRKPTRAKKAENELPHAFTQQFWKPVKEDACDSTEREGKYNGKRCELL